MNEQTNESGFVNSTDAIVGLKRVIAVDQALKDIRDRSFSGRHPELGRMIKCQVCRTRHRGSQCEQKFAVLYITEELNDETGQFEIVRESSLAKDTLKGVAGAAQFKGKRKMSRANQRGLQLVELTQTLFPKYQDHTSVKEADGVKTVEVTFPTSKEAMHAARGEAKAILKRARDKVRKKKRKQQKLSRKINRA